MWQSYCVANLAQKKKDAVFAHMAMQYMGMLLCGNPDPGPEEQECCLCAFGNMWQEYCVAILVQKKRDALHLTPCHHLPSPYNQIRHLLSLEQRRALHRLIGKCTLTIIYENNFACI